MTQNIPMPAIRAYLDGFDAGRALGHSEGWVLGRREGHRDGYLDGTADLAERLDRDFRDAQTELNKAVVEQIARRGSYALMAERRGQHQRAARQRQLLAQNGVTA